MKTCNRLTIEELATLLNGNLLGHTRVERDYIKAVRNQRATLRERLKTEIQLLEALNTDGIYEYNKLKYFDITIWVFNCYWHLKDEGNSFCFFSKNTKKGIRYYTLNKGILVEANLHFISRTLERFGNEVNTMSDLDILKGFLMISNNLTFNKDISDKYCLLDNNLVICKSLSSNHMELSTFLGELLGNEQIRIYKTLINIKE